MRLRMFQILIFEEVENLIRNAMQSKGYTPEYEVQEFVKNNL